MYGATLGWESVKLVRLEYMYQMYDEEYMEKSLPRNIIGVKVLTVWSVRGREGKNNRMK